jgi:hypothetical protein
VSIKEENPKNFANNREEDEENPNNCAKKK